MQYDVDNKQDAVWGTLEPTVDEQLNAVEGLPQKIKDTAKDKFKEKTVDVAVDKAMDEALEKAKNEKSGEKDFQE